MAKTEDEILRGLEATAVQVMRERYQMKLHSFLEPCQSPIERVMGAALVLYSVAMYSPEVFQFSGEGAWPVSDAELRDTDGFHVFAQAPVLKKYKADFLIIMRNSGKHAGVVVECDGHDFHEKTKEQAKKDKGRDREMTLSGVSVLRFTGSEIWAEPFQCANQAYDMAESLWSKAE